MTDRSRIAPLQYLRGIAALAVALAHIASLQQSLSPLSPPVLPEFAGFWGVDIFFVISGFIIVHITQQVVPGKQSAGVFLARRIVRIVPAYWFFTVLIYFSDRYHWFSDAENRTNLAMLLKSLFFLKPGFPLLFVGWTLTLEMFFYGLFALCLLGFSHRWRVMMTGCVLSCLVLLPVITDNDNRYFVFFTQTILLEFVAGMLIGYCYPATIRHRRAVNGGWMFLLVGFALLATITLAVDAQQLIRQRAMYWGGPAALIVLGAVHLPAMREIRLLSWLGDISYSLYLSHMPCAYLSVFVVQHWLAGDPDMNLFYCLLAVSFTLVVSVVSYRLFELLPQRSLRHLLRSRLSA